MTRVQGSVLRNLGLVLVCVAGFVVTTRLVRQVVPYDADRGQRSKMAAFTEVEDEIDAIYVGSSVVYRSFVPAVIDPLLTRPGEPFRSFNLGLGGMSDFEAAALLREILVRRPARLRWVVLVPPRWDPRRYSVGNEETLRSVRWHTPRGTFDALMSVALLEDALGDKLALMGEHVGVFARWLGNYGMGPAIAEAWLAGDAARGEIDAFVAQGGYRALEDEDDPRVTKRRDTFLADESAYRAAVASLMGGTQQASDLDDFNVDALVAQRREVAEVGADVVYVFPPVLGPLAVARSLAVSGRLPLVIDLHGPLAQGDLYDVDARFDKGHLDREAAAEFSRRFAQLFDVLRDEGR